MDELFIGLGKIFAGVIGGLLFAFASYVVLVMIAMVVPTKYLIKFHDEEDLLKLKNEINMILKYGKW